MAVKAKKLPSQGKKSTGQLLLQSASLGNVFIFEHRELNYHCLSGRSPRRISLILAGLFTFADEGGEGEEGGEGSISL